ncbi:MAG: Type 1 glutamine amidotransferase-like domain-containing protein [Chloroflexi bacterium]|nr:Type 1 glutamine amidotransferase-like domain-containing protein [Chloroflexota bacterium]
MGNLLLEGGAEFGGQMSEPDSHAIELAGGFDAPIAILPTAAAPDNNHEQAGRNGLRWFQSLGASRVDLVPVTDKHSANNPDLAARVRSAKFIYLLGGFPRHLGETLRDSLVWRAALEAYHADTVIGGSSAGAMVLCEYYYDPYENKLLCGLNLLPNTCVLPHHNSFGKQWSEKLRQQLPSVILIGIDEQTGILDTPSGGWTVYGAGRVTLYRNGEPPQVHARGETFQL